MTRKRILGIDPGSRITGYGIVEECEGKICPVTYGVLTLDTKKSLSYRLHQVFQGLDSLIDEFNPNEVAFEKIFFAKNVSSAMKLGHARGAAMVAAAKNNLQVFEYSATQIKKALVGYGHSSKDQLQKMVVMLLGIKEEMPLDASDALATAICHLNSNKMNLIRKEYDRPTTR